MEFEYIEYLIGILAGILISYIGALMTRWSSRLENTVEIVCALAAIGLFIWSFGFSSILIMAGLSAHSYGMFHLIFPNKRKLEKFKKDHATMEFIPLPIKRSFSRIFADLFIVGILTLLERRGWFWRILEFQFLPHPPMYWRVKSLKTNDHGWGRGILKVWWKDRLKDSIPDLKKKKHVSEQNKKCNRRNDEEIDNDDRCKLLSGSRTFIWDI